MSHVVIPRGVSDRTADVWIAAIDEDPTAGALTFGVGTALLGPGGWREWKFGGHTIRHQIVSLADLQPRTTYKLELRAGDAAVARGSVTTLPIRLPGPAERPFIVFLGSCFCRMNDDAGDVGRTFFNLPTGAMPDLKILCGDQIYLDSPWYSFAHPHRISTLQAMFTDNYVSTWTQQGGFGQLLAEGANYFSSDDHEFWNNAPSRGVYAVDTWTEASRNAWRDAARELYATFQNPSTMAEVRVEPLSIFIADTRFNRDADRLMPEAEWAKLLSWVNGLTTPGMLIVGQPIFDSKHGVGGNVLDWGLADYEQYTTLARALSTSVHSILVLTGDVHFGRVASCALRSGGEVIEVISSPLTLVDKSAGGTWSAAPEKFPAFDIPGVVKTTVSTEKGFQAFDNHFLTLEFSSSGPAAVDVIVKYWPIVSGGATPRGTVVFERTLY
jgi:hypothetical protein